MGEAALQTNYKATVNSGATASIDLEAGEPICVKLMTAGSKIHVLLTSKDNPVLATIADFLLPSSKDVEFEVSRGLDRLAIFNETGSQADVYVALMSI